MIWVPGNHELLTHRDEPDGLRGEARYRHLVELCRGLGVLTPEDPYPLWEGAGGPAVMAPLFLLYDYSFGRNIAATKEEALRLAHEAGRGLRRRVPAPPRSLPQPRGLVRGAGRRDRGAAARSARRSCRRCSSTTSP